MNHWLHKFFVASLVCLGYALNAQPFIQPIQWDKNSELYRKQSFSNKTIHTSSKSLLSNQFDSIEEDSTRWQRRKHRAWIMRKLRNESLLIVDTFDFYLTVDPLFNFQFGRDLEDTAGENLYTNTRGFLVQGAIGEKLAFYTSFYENQSFFPTYLDDHINSTGVVPGQGRPKEFNGTGFDYSMASAALSYSPAKWANIQFGHGKNFIGDGYRSLLLSDNTFNYPFLKTTFNLWNNKIRYQTIHASLQNLTRLPATTSTEAQFIRQAGTFHNLGIVPHPMVEITLFEGVVYQNWDSTGSKPLPWNFYVPIIGLNSAVEGMNSSTAKPVLGLNLRLNPFQGYMIYGQFAFDNYTTSNTSFQAGVAAYDAFTIKDLTFQVEWNNVSQNMYEHVNPQNSYKHYGGYLAHPSGNDLSEFIGIIKYSWHDFFVQAKWVYSDRRNPHEFKFEDRTVIALRNEKVTYQDYAIGYLLNPVTNMKLKVGYSGRNLSFAGGSEKTQWVYVSWITDLQNLYYDF